MACRLGFCRKLDEAEAGLSCEASQAGSTPSPSPRASLSEPFVLGMTPTPRTTSACEGGAHAASQGDPGQETLSRAPSGPTPSGPAPPGQAPPMPSNPASAPGTQRGGRGVALVVDSEVTGYLMMGALTPACKRHSVSLFEGGRVSGAAVVAELAAELEASAAAGAAFEGEMRALVGYAAGLATLMRALMAPGARGAAPRPLELLRAESLASLAPAAAHRILAASYAALVPVAGLGGAPLPQSLRRAGPVGLGPSPAAASPWLLLALLREAPGAPPALVLAAGQRCRRLPACLAACPAALLWAWAADGGAARGCAEPALVPRAGLLAALNDALARSPLLVLPLDWVAGVPPGAASLRDAVEVCEAGRGNGGFLWEGGCWRHESLDGMGGRQKLGFGGGRPGMDLQAVRYSPREHLPTMHPTVPAASISSPSLPLAHPFLPACHLGKPSPHQHPLHTPS